VAELTTLIALAAMGGAYGLGLSRAWAAAGRGRLVRTSQAWAFAAGLLVLAVALLPPLAGRSDHSLTAHMIQHVLLLVVAAPLLALGAPLPTLVWALPERWRPRASAAWRRLLRSHSAHWLAWAGGALVVESLVMAAWHLPVVYRAALHHDALHASEHASFVVTAVAFSWAVTVGAARRYPSLADQQMAGVVMWAFAGVAYVLAAACLFGVWLRGLETETPARPLAVVR